MANNGVDKNAPQPRLCHLRRWPNFMGYGFNLHCEKARPGQYIGKVDPNSPAESAGLRENDRIIEVNFVPIGTENHKQVVARIKEGVTRNERKYTEEVILLVVDQKTDDYYKSKSLMIRSSDANVLKMETEIQDGSENGSESPRSSNRSLGRADSHSAKEPSPPPMKRAEYNEEYRNPTGQTNTSSPAISRTSDRDYDNSEEHGPYHRYSPPNVHPARVQELPPTNNPYTNINESSRPSPPMENRFPKPSSINPPQGASSNGSRGIINLDMSAAEYREKLKAQSRKYDPRQNQQMSMKEKRAFIDGM